jgi:hypothetical protein
MPLLKLLQVVTVSERQKTPPLLRPWLSLSLAVNSVNQNGIRIYRFRATKRSFSACNCLLQMLS